MLKIFKFKQKLDEENVPVSTQIVMLDIYKNIDRSELDENNYGRNQ